MSDAAPASPPVLVALAKELNAALARLEDVTLKHRQLKQTLQQVERDGNSSAVAGLTLELAMGDLRVPLPMPQEYAAQVAYLQEALAGLGDEAVRVWRLSHNITSKAVAHLDELAAKQG